MVAWTINLPLLTANGVSGQGTVAVMPSRVVLQEYKQGRGRVRILRR